MTEKEQQKTPRVFIVERNHWDFTEILKICTREEDAQSWLDHYMKTHVFKPHEFICYAYDTDGGYREEL